MLEKNIFIADLIPGKPVEEVFLLSEAGTGQARNGPFKFFTLTDRTGKIAGKIFHPQSGQCPELKPGMAVRVSGNVGVYRDQPQIVAERVDVLDSAELNMADFLVTGKTPPEELLKDLEQLIKENIRHKPWLKFVRRVLTDAEVKNRLMQAPGAKTIHHAYAGGLLEHTLAVCRLCVAFSCLYPELDKETLLAAAVFHDMGKAWELTSGPVLDYTDEGRLLGHIQIAIDILEPFLAKAEDLAPELKLHFKHLILSHHGQYEYGSPRLPQTAEALALHYADNMDAKMNTVAGALDDLEGDGPAWSSYQRSLERALYRPVRTPGADDDRAENDGMKQCSLLWKE